MVYSGVLLQDIWRSDEVTKSEVTKVLWAMAPILFCAIHGNFVLCFSLALPIQFLCFARGGKPCRQLFGDTVPFEILNGYSMVQVEPFC